MIIAEKVLELAGLMRKEASTVVVYNEGAARGLESWARRIEDTVNAEAPSWVTLAEARSLRGWSDRYLRDLAKKNLDCGRARRTARGYELAYDLVRALPVKPSHDRVIRSDADLEALGRQLGGEG